MLALLLLVTFAGTRAADIKPLQSTFDDYLPLLNMDGYHVYSFDIKSLADREYTLAFTCREYHGDSLVNNNILRHTPAIRNMLMLSEFSEEDRATIKPEDMYDADRGIIACAEKMIIGTLSKNDSTTTVMISVENRMTFSTPLALKPMHNPETSRDQYWYETRPFKVGEIKLDTFMPLMLYGSGWYDPRYKVLRFCGEGKLEPDMSSEMIREIPHSYVVGVTITEK